MEKRQFSFAQLTDEQLVLRVQQSKDTNAYGELYNRYYPKIFRNCVFLTRDFDIAFDITQEVFLKAMNHLERLNAPGAFSSWLYRIAYNESIDYLKDRRRVTFEAKVQSFDRPDEGFDREEAESREQTYHQIDILLNEVSPHAKAMLLSKYCDNKSIQDLQEEYGLTESAVKMRLARARRRIAKLYRKKSVA